MINFADKPTINGATSWQKDSFPGTLRTAARFEKCLALWLVEGNTQFSRKARASRPLQRNGLSPIQCCHCVYALLQIINTSSLRGQQPADPCLPLLKQKQILNTAACCHVTTRRQAMGTDPSQVLLPFILSDISPPQHDPISTGTKLVDAHHRNCHVTTRYLVATLAIDSIVTIWN
ncbi:hypothetical protein [Burkholderia ubonensis]|uniref:hypothetical protein n=1 Tax=Burkholderia ubonensis TaxID=101571 RepID=UPI0012F8F4F5|nr:hypothetical protein [Burkholderia ubonensis]